MSLFCWELEPPREFTVQFKLSAALFCCRIPEFTESVLILSVEEVMEGEGLDDFGGRIQGVPVILEPDSRVGILEWDQK